MVRSSFTSRLVWFPLACLLSVLAGSAPAGGGTLTHPNTIYETNYQNNTLEAFALSGGKSGLIATISFPTGLTFDRLGNLYVSSDDPTDYAIYKITPSGTMSVFADSGLRAPHALVFDADGNLYLANATGASIMKFTPDGAGTIFADASDGIVHPIDLAFDSKGNLFVTNAFGGPTGNGFVQKFSPSGTGSIFAEDGFSLAYGLAIDGEDNVYVGNYRSSTIEKFSPDGTDLGLFASAGVNKPHGMIFDKLGNLYVANNGNATIEKFSPTGSDLGRFAVTGPGPHFLAMFGNP